MKTMGRFFIGFAGLLLLLGAMFPIVAAQEGTPVATLTVFLGDVKYRESGTSDWQLVRRGMFFYAGDRIKTHEDGKAEVYFSNGSIVHVGNESEIEFQPLEKKSKKRSLFLFGGKLWNKVVTGTDFEVESIYAVAAVKGTILDTEVKDDFKVWVTEGFVEIANDQGKVLAEKNTLTVVQKGQSPDKSSIRVQDLPKRVDLAAKLSASLRLVGERKDGQEFKVKITLRDAKTNKIFRDGDVVLKAVTQSDGLEISADGSAWSKDAEITVSKGSGTILLKGRAGEHRISVAGSRLYGVDIGFSIKAVKTKKTVNIEYEDAEGKRHVLRLDLKRK